MNDWRVPFWIVVTWIAFGFFLFGHDYARAQALRQGQQLPSGPPRYYLREGSPQEICAPQKDRKGWICFPVSTVIETLQGEPPECPQH